MQPCRVSFAALVDYQEQRADPAATQGLEKHLEQGCEACRSRLAQLQRMLTGLNGRDLLEAPATVYARLQSAFRERYLAGPARPPLIARPVFDSRSRLAFAGMPGVRGGVGETFQVIHSTVEHDIHLWAEKQYEQAWYLIGQVLPHIGDDSVAPELAALHSTDGTSITAEADGTEFHLATVPSGSYTLRLRLPAGEVLVPDIMVGR